MKRILLTLFFAAILSMQTKAETITVTDNMIGPDQVVQWTSDNTYILDGYVYVENGAELWIEAGTVIKGKPGEGSDASALVITRGAKIYAEGTPTRPIIFTAEADDVNNPNDFTKDDRGLWGGLIVLGNATINVAGGEENIEGIPVEETRGVYGGNDDNDNSGVIRFVSIRHGGSNIGADNEINGLSLGAVGRGTTVEYIEVFANKDDAVEWFGGTVNTKYLVSAFCGDDGFDYDEGFRGKGQFWFVIQDDLVAGSAGEHDGGTTPEDGQPYAMPVVYNATYIGSGKNSTNTKNTPFINMRDNAGGKYYSSIFMDGAGFGLQIEDLTSGEDSRSRLEAGDLEFTNNIWYDFKDGIADAATNQFALDYLNESANNNRVTNPMLKSISRIEDGMLDPRPANNSPALTGAKVAPNDGFYTPVDYVGAFGKNDLWVKGWTFLYEGGFIQQNAQNIVNITDASINAGDKVYWTSDNIYVLDGFVFVEEGAELHIEAGTVIKGKPGEGSDATALVITRDAKIFAEGSPTQPIIFTAEADDINDPTDFTKDDRGLWGGLIVLGNATINVAGGEENIEGIPVEETRGVYGGDNDNDNSGVIRFVSIRHGGSNIGADNEINGLSLGAVGRGTTIEYIEVFANKDDAVEWFGGTVDTKFLVAAFCGDDGYDYDEGFRGKGQFWLVIQDDLVAGSAGEHDGGTTPEDGQPYAMPVVYNATYIGSGKNSTNTKNTPFINMRDNAGGKYFSSIFMDGTGYGLQIEDLTSGEDSRSRLEAGEIEFTNNIWFDFKNGIADAATNQFALDYLNNASNNNRTIDPMLMNISRIADGTFDPRPAENSPAWTGAKVAPNDGFYTPVEFIGAFGDKNWAVDWTFIGEGNYISANGAGMISLPTSVVEKDDNYSPVLKTSNIVVYPNPVNYSTNIEFSIEEYSQVKLSVYNMLGQEVAVIVNKVMTQGVYGYTWTPENLPSGVYNLVMFTGRGQESVQIVIE